MIKYEKYKIRKNGEKSTTIQEKNKDVDRPVEV